MILRPLGRTGIQVSRLGFGCMRLPMQGEGEGARVDRDLAIPMLHRAQEAGVTYFDTAVGYCNRDSQNVLGEAMVGRRDRVILSTKNHDFGDDEKTWWSHLENSLWKLRTSYLDIYNHHGISWETYRTHIEPRVGKWMRKARDQKLVRHVCVSIHDNCENLKKIVATGYAESITLQYNLFDRSLEEGIAAAAAAGMGVVVMGPVAGGRLGVQSQSLQAALPGIERVPELALRFVLANPGVTLALSGMSTMQQVEENLAIGADERSLTAGELAQVLAHMGRLKGLSDLYCTGCGYCLPCPQGVAIPKIFERYNLGRVYDMWRPARDSYGNLGNQPWDPGQNASHCIECGECEAKCPQQIPIRQQLQEAHEQLSFQ